MDFRYIIILISGLFFYPIIDQLTESKTDGFTISVILGYMIVMFFISPLILDSDLK